MVSNAPIAGIGLDALSKKKHNPQNDVEASDLSIEPAPNYTPDEEEKDGSEEINYHTLNWWYVHQTFGLTIRPRKLTLTGKPEWS
jgi:hypothetical protein